MASPTARPTMPSADFCAGVRVPRSPLSLVSKTRRRPPEVSSIAFTAHPPDLQPRALDGYGLRDQLSARPTRAASYPVSVRQVAALLHASFRPRLAATPLRFANTSPPSGCVGDLHPLAIEHARHTTKPLRGRTLKYPLPLRAFALSPSEPSLTCFLFTSAILPAPVPMPRSR